MLIIRLARIGKSKQPFFRLIINEKSKDTRGDYLENLGSFNPKTKQLTLKTERIRYWLGKGAQTSATVHNLLIDHKLIAGPKRKNASVKQKTIETPKQEMPGKKEEPKT